MNPRERKKAAKEFIKRWENRGAEKKDSQSFWLDLLSSVFNIEHPSEYITFEDEVMMDHTSFTDGYIKTTNVLIEQKGKHRDLNKGLKQSDGSFLTPFQQAKRYSANLPYSRRPRWIITCNFSEFFIYDMENPNAEPSIVKLKDLENEFYRLEILVDKTNTQIEKETEISIKAGELIGQIYDELIVMYRDPESPHTLESINQLCVRFVFCFYAEDAGLFGKRGMFHDYLIDFETRFFRRAIVDLFRVLNTKSDERDPYLDDKLAEFPFVNGGLFEDMNIEIPQFTEHLRDLILKNASSDFNWSDISPTIFGGVFESTLNPETRHKGGMHYTSIENIHKVIDPLFLDELKNELNEIKQYKQKLIIQRKAKEFQNKLASLNFFDPACGSGNFLTETYLALRELENQALVLSIGDYVRLDIEKNIIKVSLKQFYGIEINDFAASVAKTAMWIAESQMFEKTKDIIFSEIDFFPIKSYSNIVQGNALKIDWQDIVNSKDLDFIIGNPPFLGARLMSSEQTLELKHVFKNQQGVNDLDYVSGWYKLASEFIKGTDIQCAFVSTNSIVQGQQVMPLWRPLMEQSGIVINFAYRTFNWQSEANDKAAVHVVIISFSQIENKIKKLYHSNNQVEIVKNINGYLIDAQSSFIENRSDPISNVPKMIFGNMANDGGNLILSLEEKDGLIRSFPEAQSVIRKFLGAREMINNIERYCLWIEKENLKLVSESTQIMERIKKCQLHRLKSKRDATKKLAETPYAFGEIRQPKSNYLMVPRVSSENRRYIPIGYFDESVIASDAALVIPNASLYHFSVISSNVHMAWMRTVAGRLKSDYRYSARIVYNNFPWVTLTREEKDILSKNAQNILNARDLYSEMSFAQLYDELIMPPELRKAHQENDRAVMKIYGMPIVATSESKSVEKLFELYKIQVSQLK